jgi:hypothetical protein
VIHLSLQQFRKKHLYRKDTTVTVSDTSYNTGSNQYGYYFNVDGSVNITYPLYDTIAAHDTTYTCNDCATCHRIDTIITPVPPDERLYGVFILPVPLTPLAQRLHRIKTEGLGTIFRDNQNSNTFIDNSKQIHDSALLQSLTYNYRHPQQIAYFPTGAGLNLWADTLSYNLRRMNQRPDFIHFENEEANTLYHKGTVYDYINLLQRGIDTAHKYGIAVGNGGTIQNIVAYIRYVYQQEGKTDSANLIRDSAHLPQNPNAYGLAVIDWNKVFIPWVAQSNLDFIDLHWYEYFNNNIRDRTTTSKLLPIVINFLQSRTGKPVISTEIGTRGDNQPMFNEMMNECKNAGMNRMIYFSGNGPAATDHADYWALWLLL